MTSIMKKSNILLALAIPAVLLSCSKDPDLPYDLAGTKHTIAISVTKLTEYDKLLNNGSTAGDFRVRMDIPKYMGDYSSFFKWGQLLCVYTPYGGTPYSVVAIDSITEYPSEHKINMPDLCGKLGIDAPISGDKMQFCANVVHKDGTVIPGWTSTMGFNYRAPSFFTLDDTIYTDFSYCATYSAMPPINLTYYAGGNKVKFTESVGSAGEATYGANVTRLADIPAEVVGAGYEASDYIGIQLDLPWYGWGYNCTIILYINTKDLSVTIPEQIGGVTDEEFYYAGYGNGHFEFYSGSGELDTQVNQLSFSMGAYWAIDTGDYAGMGIDFGVDNYIIDFATVL